MDRAQLLRHFDTLGETPDAVSKLRALVRDLAIRGRLVPQEDKDDPFNGELARKNAADGPQSIYYAKAASGTSSSMKNITREGVSMLPVAIPPLAEQKR